MPDSHLDAIALDSDSINTCHLQAMYQDVACDHLIASDQCLWVVRGKDEDVSRDEDVQKWLVEAWVDLDVEDRLANADPVSKGRMVLDGWCMADQLHWRHWLEHLEQILGIHADVPCIKVAWCHEGKGHMGQLERELLGCHGGGGDGLERGVLLIGLPQALWWLSCCLEVLRV